MRGRIRGVVQALAVPTIALAVVLAFLPGRAGIAVRGYALFLAGVVIVLALGALRRALPPPSALRESARGSARARVPASLARLDDEIALAEASAYDYHHRLRRRLHALAAGLLSSRRRVALDREPERARELLGDEAWGLVRADRPLPEDRNARGPAHVTLAETVTALERL